MLIACQESVGMIQAKILSTDLKHAYKRRSDFVRVICGHVFKTMRHLPTPIVLQKRYEQLYS